MSSFSQEAPLYSDLAADPDLRELVELFVSELPDRVNTLLQQLQDGDLEGLRRTAHQLKGAAGSYGFEPVSPCAARLEDMIASGASEDDIRPAVDELAAMCRRVSAESPQ